MASPTPYNISLTSSSPEFIYSPFRGGSPASQGDPAGGWRSSLYDFDWTVWTGTLGTYQAGQPVREAYANGASVSLQFEGTAIYLCVSPTGSSYTFTVDNNPVTTSSPASSDPACANTDAQVMAYATGLAYGSHSATVQVNAGTGADFLFHGGVVTLGVTGPYPTVRRIDDTDPRWNLQPASTWTGYVGNEYTQASYNGTCTWTCSWGSAETASYTFSSERLSPPHVPDPANSISDSSTVLLIGKVSYDSGPFTIQLDGQSSVWNNSDLWWEEQQVLFFQSGLDPTTQHTIGVSNWDGADSNATRPSDPGSAPCFQFDELVLIQPGTLPPNASGSPTSSMPGASPTGKGSSGSGSGSSSFPVAAVAGGAAGGAVALCILALLLWLCFRRRPEPVDDEPPFPLPEDHMTQYITSAYYPPSTFSQAEYASQSTSQLEQGTISGQISDAPPAPAPAPRPGVGEPKDSGGTLRVLSASTLPPGAAPASPPGAGTAAVDGASTQALLTVLVNRLLRGNTLRGHEDAPPPEYDDAPVG
ncbi:hypothetical protein DACRYDRAFT_112434 [Dacryopinax primogenitus]|uniref:Uncharacterized protein n=1 Tax=Dacryopinax primogenitus (strain DJM 731) TaxID=1858805 RepID=M5FZ90_DACPD|nr:uncharacterized protein DACRYDRAFT_112434 [Dacryopinax primogenitus]EJT96817.1 hypothetical protein DACRYDRAFT_112434 [Dacryopinax primogenitus]